MIKSAFNYFFGRASAGVAIEIKLLRYAQSKEWKIFSRLIANRMQRKYAFYLSPNAAVHPSVKFVHPVGVVVGLGCVIGENCRIYQNVTLGGGKIGDAQDNNFPTLDENVVVFAGAVIVGKVKIGKGAIVGANSVVTKDVPDYCTVAGAPAKIISSRNC